MAELDKEHFVASIIEEEQEISCWGCGLRLILPSSAPIFKCGWCGAITNQNARKSDNKWFWWRRFRDRCFVCVLLTFILFVICGGVWAVYPVVFSISFVCGIFHIIVTILLSVTTISTFGLASFRCAGKPPPIVWGSYPVVGKGGLQNYTFCRHCSRPKSPRTHHCRSCGMCVLDMDHHCPFIGNCVGAENHQHFIAFLISAVTSTTYAAVMCAYAGLQIAPPLKTRPNFRFQVLSSETALGTVKDMILDWLGSVVLMSARGIILFYLFVSSISVATGLSVLLWQQLSYIYEGKTYLAHLSSLEGENAADKDCNNVLRFLGCPYFVSRYLSNFQNNRKRHTK